MPSGILIPADETRPLLAREFDSLGDYQAAVGGYIQNVELASTNAALFVNEEARYFELPINRRATLLLWMHNRAFIRQDHISGDAVLIGAPDDDGITTSVPESLAQLLMEARSFTIEAILKSAPNEWFLLDNEATSWHEAYLRGFEVLTTWSALVDVRIRVVQS
jgi:hypothetical protein